MEWLKDLRNKIVGLDTAPLIYFIEENPGYLHVVQPFFEAVAKGSFRTVTSSLTIAEVLVQPFRKGNKKLVEEYLTLLLNAESLFTIDVTPEIAETAARLRAEHNMRTPDAIQVATAVNEGASFFLTNDSRLKSIKDLRVLVLSDLK
jgi:predicted nucleic acid-binding protein